MRTLLHHAWRVVRGGMALGALLGAGPVFAQMGMPPGIHPGVAQSMQQPPYSMAGGWMDAHGDPLVQQAGYGAPCGPGGCGPMMGGGPMGGCGPMGGGYGGGMGGNPYGGGMNVEQCGPHYFDFSAEYLNYTRDGSPIGGGTVLSTFGFANLVGGVVDQDQVIAQQAINGDDVGGGDYDGYRLTGRLDVGALSVFEVAYSGLYDTDGDGAVAISDTGGTITPGIPMDDQTLYTIFTEYGSGTGGVIAGPDFAETDDALEHRIGYESELHTVEATYRRYWVGYHPRVSGTWLVGFRYTNLQETLGFFSRSADGSINLDLEADNKLAGAQIGGDAWVTILQGLRIGGEAKVGIYNNDYDASISEVASDGDPNGLTTQADNQVAFLTEAKVTAVANLTASLSARGGYEVLYISDIATVGDNLLANPPYGGTGVVSADGDALWHGWHAGLEFIW